MPSVSFTSSCGRAALLVLLAFVVLACNLRPPISVGRRDSQLGQGIVLSVTNTSGDYLHEVKVEIRSPEGETKEHLIPTLQPHESMNVGWLKLDGWKIPEGSEVTVRVKDYYLAGGPWTS